MELSEVVSFFTTFANDVPGFCDQVLSPTGLPLVIVNMKYISTQVDDDNGEIHNRLCWVVFNISVPVMHSFAHST
jgi:hypothetical protein